MAVNTGGANSTSSASNLNKTKRTVSDLKELVQNGGGTTHPSGESAVTPEQQSQLSEAFTKANDKAREIAQNNLSGGKITTKTPYLDMYKNYQKSTDSIRDAYLKQMDSDRSAQEDVLNNQYDNSARMNYVRYMQNKKNLPSELNALGINGGASESALLRLGTSYGSAAADNEAARNANLAALAQTFADRRAEYQANIDSQLRDAYLQMLENQNAYDRDQERYDAEQERYQREKDLEYFANSITGRFSTLGEYDALIAELQKSDDPNKEYKIALAQQARNAFALQMGLIGGGSSGGGGGSSYRSYGGSSGSSSGSDGTLSSTNPTDAVADSSVGWGLNGTALMNNSSANPYDSMTNRIAQGVRDKSRTIDYSTRRNIAKPSDYNGVPRRGIDGIGGVKNLQTYR